MTQTLCCLIALAMPTDMGDPALLDWVRAANATNETKVKKGSLSATVNEVSSGNERKKEIFVVWDGDASYVECTSTETTPEAYVGGPNRHPQKSIRHLIAIRRGGEKWIYDVDQKHLEHITDPKLENALIHPVCPDGVWFRPVWSKRRWVDLIDPELFPPSKFSVIATRTKGGRVSVLRTLTESDESEELIWAPDCGGHLVSAQATMKKVVEDTKYEWVQLEGGAWYPLRVIFERTTPTGTLVKRTVFEIHEFDPSPAITPDRFDPNSLKLDPEAFIREMGPGGTRGYRLGNAPSTPRLPPFLDLIEAVRSRGFAERDRKR